MQFAEISDELLTAAMEKARADGVFTHANDFFRAQGKAGRMLCIGCGKDPYATLFALEGYNVDAIDITENSALFQSALAERLGIDRLRARTMDALDIAQLGTYDLVFGSKVLHHIEPFDQFCRTLNEVMGEGSVAFFYENNARSRVLIWCRNHLVGRFGIPKYGDEQEHPLTEQEIDDLRKYFTVDVAYPEMYFCRLISMYLTRGKFSRFFSRLDDFLWRFDSIRKYSYFQTLAITGRS